MAMPSEFELYKHYGSVDEFRLDEQQMIRQKWRASSFRTHEVKNTGIARIFGGISHVEVDARYVGTYSHHESND